MLTRFSKPSADVDREYRSLVDGDAALNADVARIAGALAGRPPRGRCAACAAAPLAGDRFGHRGVGYVRCAGCGHVQTTAMPPAGYPAAANPGVAFQAIYPPLPPDARRARMERVYKPKLDWVLDGAAGAGLDRRELLGARWVELGCGEGLFLEALREAGGNDFLGLDADPELARRAGVVLGPGRAEATDAPLVRTLADTRADVYAAFFVLEHLDDVHAFFEELGRKPKGTLFAFAVPVFGLSAVMESAFDGHYPRCLDSAVHTQLFTDSSIARCLDTAGFEPVSEWLFGQDAGDLRRMLLLRLREVYPEALLRDVDARLGGLADALQGVLDEARFCDARHVLAVKR